jgi:CobQ-like glutamine amidotransferase family enzyme
MLAPLGFVTISPKASRKMPTVKEDGTEGVHYKNVYGSYFHGPILSRNANLAYRLVTTALKNKYGSSIALPSYNDILSKEVAEEYADTKSKAEFEK